MLRGHGRGIVAATWSVDGRFVLTAGADGTARVWTVDRGDNVVAVRVEPPAYGIAFALGGKAVASTEGSRVRMRSPLTGVIIHEIPARGRFLTSLSATANGRCLATDADHGDAQLWDAANARQISDFGPMASFSAVPFSGDGKRVALIRGNSAEVHNTRTGRILAAVDNGKCTPTAASLNHRGDLLVTACSGNDAVVWRVADQHVVSTLRGHRGRIESAASAPRTGRC